MESPLKIEVKSQKVLEIKPRICDVCFECFEDCCAFDDHYKSHSNDTNKNQMLNDIKIEEKSSPRKSFNCNTCNMTFFLERSLRYHLCPNLGERSHACHLCIKRFGTRKLLMAHIRTHEKRHKCEMCGKRFANNISLITHCRRHIGDFPYVCEICGKKFPSSHNLQLHKNTHLKPFKCAYCDESFARKQQLTDHNREHEGKGKYSCIYCQRCFAYKAYLERHQCALDPGNRFTCDKCNKTFSMKHILERHRIAHDAVKLHKCNLCTKNFIKKSDLTKHMLYHSENKVFSCNICSKNFIRRYDLVRHEQVHNKKRKLVFKYDTLENKLDAHNEATNNKEEKQSVKCDLCYKIFKEKYNMLKHRLRHFDNKSFECGMCHKTFRWNYELERHHASKHKKDVQEGKKLQVGGCELNKNYECEKCGNVFTYQISLVYHHCKNSQKKSCSSNNLLNLVKTLLN